LGRSRASRFNTLTPDSKRVDGASELEVPIVVLGATGECVTGS